MLTAASAPPAGSHAPLGPAGATLGTARARSLRPLSGCPMAMGGLPAPVGGWGGHWAARRLPRVLPFAACLFARCRRPPPPRHSGYAQHSANSLWMPGGTSKWPACMALAWELSSLGAPPRPLQPPGRLGDWGDAAVPINEASRVLPAAPCDLRRYNTRHSPRAQRRRSTVKTRRPRSGRANLAALAAVELT